MNHDLINVSDVAKSLEIYVGSSADKIRQIVPNRAMSRRDAEELLLEIKFSLVLTD